MPRYEHSVSLMSSVLEVFSLLLYALFSPGKGIGYMDSTSLAVCQSKRIRRNKGFKGIARLDKTTKGWFFGLKLHLIVDEKGNLMRAKLSPGHGDDRQGVDPMTQGFTGWLFGDKGYLSKKLFLRLYRREVKLVTDIKKTRENTLMHGHEKLLLRKRYLIETVFDYLKNKLQLEHTRHLSPINALIPIVPSLICYQLKPTKPSISYHFALPKTSFGLVKFAWPLYSCLFTKNTRKTYTAYLILVSLCFLKRFFCLC